MGPLSHYNLQQLSVLLVESNELNRKMVADVLRTMGVRRLHECADPGEGFETLCAEPVDLVFTDWSPDLDGIDLLQRIRRDPRSPDRFVPVVVISANTELKHIYRARDAGMTEFLAKPFKARLIYSRICAIIERHRVFIRNSSFFGPDRRRRRVRVEGPDRRTHANRAGVDRRVGGGPYAGPERRLGEPEFVDQDFRGDGRG